MRRVIPEAIEASWVSQSPVVLVLHARGNDICLMRLYELLNLIQTDLERIMGYFAELILILS